MAKCKIEEIKKASTETESIALDNALNLTDGNTNYVWSAKALATAVNKTRFSIGATTIKEHRRQNCGCF